VRDHAPVIKKAADVIGGLPADNIRSFMYSAFIFSPPLLL
jgi:hypothetical protein